MAIAVPKPLGERVGAADDSAHKAEAEKCIEVTSMEEFTPHAEKVAFYQDVFRELLGDYERMLHKELQRKRQNEPRRTSHCSNRGGSRMLGRSRDDTAPEIRILSEPNTPAEKNREPKSSVSREISKDSGNRKGIRLSSEYHAANEHFDDSGANSILKTCCTRIVRHRHFEKVVGLIIAMNAMFNVVSADYAINNIENPNTDGSFAVELCFCILYIIELGLRLVVFRCGFFTNEDRAWNLFDTGLVLQSVYEQVTNVLPSLQGSAGNLSFLRTLRLAKVIKVMRVIRVMRSMSELRLIMTSILGSLKSMFWSLVLIMVVLCMFSLLFVQSVAAILSDDTELTEEDVGKLLDSWGGVIRGMRTLFAASTGGVDWLDVAYPLLQIGWTFFVVFCFYIAFFTFVILNTITALFVEAIISSSMKDHQSCIQREIEKKQEYVERLKLLFDTMDIDGDGLVSMHEFQMRMNDPRLKAFAASLGIEIADTAHFFALLTDQGNKSVDLDAFVTGCIRMKGPATSVDLQEMRHCTHKILDMLGENAKNTRVLQERYMFRSKDVQEMRFTVSEILEKLDMLSCSPKSETNLLQLANNLSVHCSEDDSSVNVDI